MRGKTLPLIRNEFSYELEFNILEETTEVTRDRININTGQGKDQYQNIKCFIFLDAQFGGTLDREVFWFLPNLNDLKKLLEASSLSAIKLYIGPHGEPDAG